MPSDRLAALRKAFDDVMKHQPLLEEAGKLQADISWLSGEDCLKIVRSIIEADPKVIARARDIIGAHAK